MSVAEQCLMNSLAKTPRNQPDKPRASSRSASPSVSPLTFSAAPDPFSPRIRVVLFASLQRPLKRNRFQEKQMANSLGRWRGREGWGGGIRTGCRDSPGAAPCSKGKTSPPGPQRPDPPAETAFPSRQRGAEPFFPLLFFPPLTRNLPRNRKWPPSL